jgi:hypothetical protein
MWVFSHTMMCKAAQGQGPLQYLMTVVRPTWGLPRPDHLSTEPAHHTKSHRDGGSLTAPSLNMVFPTKHPQIHTAFPPASRPRVLQRKYSPRAMHTPTSLPLPLEPTTKEATPCCRHTVPVPSRTTTHEPRLCSGRHMGPDGCSATRSIPFGPLIQASHTTLTVHTAPCPAPS